MNDAEFQTARREALDEIRAAIIEKMKEVSIWSSAFVKGRKIDIEAYLKLQETCRWPAQILYALDEMKTGKDMKVIFSRVSARYQGPAAERTRGLATDLYPSDAAKHDGRLSAFEDVLKVLSVAARDLDVSYRPPAVESFSFWQEKQPDSAAPISSLHWSAQIKYAQEALQALREVVEDLQKKDPAGPGPLKRKSWPSLS